MNILVRFEVKPDYNRGAIVVNLIETRFVNGDRWKKSNILYSRTAKIKSFLGLRIDVGYKVAKIKRDLAELYKKESRLRGGR